MRIISDVHSPEAQALWDAPVFSFDIETNTDNQHWDSSGKRGLSYCADMTEIGFYCGEDWTLILSAKPVPVEYAATKFDLVDGVLQDAQYQYSTTRWEFSSEDQEFIVGMFTRDEERTAIAHNLVFDARQIFGKFNLPVKDNYTFWDTRSIYKLRDDWRPGGVIDDEDEEEEGDFTEEDPKNQRDGAADLMSIYEMYVQKLDEGYKIFVSFMKDQRKNFPRIDFKKVPEGVVSYINTTPEVMTHSDALNAYLVLMTEKSMTSKQKEKKRLQDEADAIDMSGLIADLMHHYVTFDVIAPYEIYQQQCTPPSDYPKYPKLLEEDLKYIRFCVEVAAKGMRVDRPYAIAKLKSISEAYIQELHAIGMTADDWDRVLKRDFLIQYIFWGNKFDAQFKTEKNYAKNVKEAIAAAEAAGEISVNAYPESDVLEAYQFTLLTKNGQKKFAKGEAISGADFSFGTKAMKDWLRIFPDMKELRNIGRLSKLKGAITFLEMMLRESECDGRAHTLLGRFAATGRNTSSAPNLQNIHFDGSDPITDMSGILVADNEDFVLIELDYSNAENYSAAMISADENMAYACCSTDFHTTRAGFFFGKDVMAGLTPDERKKKRSQAKTVGFGEGYGMGAKKLAITLGTTIDEAQHLLNLSAAAFPDLAAAKESARAFADKNGWIPTWSGRRMKIPKRFNPRTYQWEYSSYTNGWNSPNQGGVAEIVVRAINQIRDWLLANNYRTYISSQVHDSLIINLALDEYPFVPQKIVQIMGSILDDEVRYKAKGDEPAVTWNNSTSPAIRWLVDLDNIGNSHKWGFESNREYPLPIEEYVNKWGVHKLTEAEMKEGKAPTWINSFGYGEDALKRELAGELGVELELPEPRAKKETFQWAKLQHALSQLNNIITPMQINGHILDWPTAMMALQLQYERGESNDFVVVQEHLSKLQAVMEEYKAWQYG